jgi:hypothetical protein
VLIGEAYFDACCPSMLLFVGTLLDEAFSGAMAFVKDEKTRGISVLQRMPTFS